jgi:restriction system protein
MAAWTVSFSRTNWGWTSSTYRQSATSRHRRCRCLQVRDFAGSLEAHKAPKGVFVTTAFLPASARKFVDAVPRRITLLDGDGLAELMIRHHIGVKPEPVHLLKELDPAFFSLPLRTS